MSLTENKYKYNRLSLSAIRGQIDPRTESPYGSISPTISATTKSTPSL